ncbi:tyrosine-type recombinase/integrase [Paludisphaera rhizosphaerae]|uniref:tyrosine-type recombinase/integrase n=1 Tax=Paludisphaera rhizosphaerae TaxID=2711216 RepID=UPI0013EB6B6D|nr:tyrosine-type recombinase/integrase [Paludisphaera rhizosphaerae]
MARRPEVRAKNGYWYSEAGGSPRYYGKVEETPQEVARAALWAFLAGKEESRPVGRQRHLRMSLATLRTKFLEWVGRHRAAKNHLERTRHINRFVEFVGEAKPADSIDSKAIDAFTSWMASQSYSLDYQGKHLTSIKAMFRRAVRQGWIRPCDPFARVEPIHLPPKSLSEGDLPTAEEVAKLFNAGDSFDHMGDLLRLYHATGARSYELIRARVGDYDRRASAIVLREHKTARKTGKVRTIHLSGEAVEILEKHLDGKTTAEPIFQRPSGGAYTSVNLAERFQSVRGRAGVRSSITVYSFRHLWISECLMAGLDVLLIARMAGTSVKMIEQVYGRFRTSTFQDAHARLEALRTAKPEAAAG